MGSLWVLSVLMAGLVAVADPFSVVMLVFTTVGGVVAWVRRRSPVGWLLLADGLVWLGGSAANAYVTASGPFRPGAQAAAASFDLAGWVVAVGLIPLLLVVFPTGRPPTRRWQLVVWLIVGGGGIHALTSLVTPGPLPSWPEISNPFGVERFGALASAIAPLAELIFFVGFAGALLSVIVRFRRSSGVERQQLRWLAFAAVLMAVSFAVGVVADAVGFSGAWVFNVVPLLAVPVAVGVAVLRYRLWDLDVVIARTLTYGLVGLTVAAVYVVVVAGVGALIGAGAGSDVWLAALATAIVGAVFHPLRDAAQAGVRRLVFRDAAGVAQAPLSIRTLGGFRVERAGEPVRRSEWQSKKARQLLKMLIARRGRPVHRDVLIDTLWPGASTGNLANRLSVALSTVRSVLDPDKAHPSDHYVKADADTLWLDLDHVAVDVEQFLTMADAGTRTYGHELEAAEALYRGDFLEEDLYEDWAWPLRERARATYLDVLRIRADAAPKRGADATIAAHRKILEVDPYDETAHLAIVAALRSAGRHGEAQRAYQHYATVMREVGVHPNGV